MLGRLNVDGIAGSTTQVDPATRADLALGASHAGTGCRATGTAGTGVPHIRRQSAVGH